MTTKFIANEGYITYDGTCSDSCFDLICQQSPVIAKTLSGCGNMPITKYLQAFTSARSNSGLQGREDLAEVICEYAGPLLGEAVASRAAADVLAHPCVLTANHHGVDYFAQSVQGSLLFALARQSLNGHGGTVPVFSCGSVPLDNLTYPLGFLMYHSSREQAAALPQKLPLFSNRLRRSLVTVAQAFDQKMVQRARKRVEKMAQEQQLPGHITAVLLDLLQTDYSDPAITALPTYSQQAVVLNQRIWKRLFADPQDAPDMVYLEMEEIVRRLLERDLNNPNSLAWQVFFDPELREAVVQALDGAKTCWDQQQLQQRLEAARTSPGAQPSVNTGGTVFFWGINAKGRRIPLVIQKTAGQPEMLVGVDDRGTFFQQPFTPDALSRGLERKQLLPALFTSFLTLAFARGVVCAGGYFQSEYLPQMQKGLVQALKQAGHQGETAGLVGQVKTDGYLSGMQTVMSQVDGDLLLPAGPLEILAGGGLTRRDIHKIKRLTVQQAHMASLLETVPDIDPDMNRELEWKMNVAVECHEELKEQVVIK